MRECLRNAVFPVVLDRPRNTVVEFGVLADQAKSFSVFDGSSRIDGASSSPRGRTSTSPSRSMPIAFTVASKSSLIEKSLPDDTW